MREINFNERNRANELTRILVKRYSALTMKYLLSGEIIAIMAKMNCAEVAGALICST